MVSEEGKGNFLGEKIAAKNYIIEVQTGEAKDTRPFVKSEFASLTTTKSVDKQPGGDLHRVAYVRLLRNQESSPSASYRIE